MRPFSFNLISVSRYTVKNGKPFFTVYSSSCRFFFRYRFNFLLPNNEVTVSDLTPNSSWGSQPPSGPLLNKSSGVYPSHESLNLLMNP